MMWHTYGEVCQLRQDWLQEGEEAAVADDAQDEFKQLRNHCREGEVIRVLVHLAHQHESLLTWSKDATAQGQPLLRRQLWSNISVLRSHTYHRCA